MTRKRIADTLDWQAIEDRLALRFSEASPRQYADGLGWYSEASRFADGLSTFLPIDKASCAGIIAALSPQSNWPDNKQQAETLCNGGEIHNTDSRLGKAYEILGGASPIEALNGPKETAFFLSITEPITSRAACIDRHMCRAALDVTTDKEITLWMDRAGIYEGIADAIANIADRNEIPVAACQAIIWNVIRDRRAGRE